MTMPGKRLAHHSLTPSTAPVCRRYLETLEEPIFMASFFAAGLFNISATASTECAQDPAHQCPAEGPDRRQHRCPQFLRPLSLLVLGRIRGRRTRERDGQLGPAVCQLARDLPAKCRSLRRGTHERRRRLLVEPHVLKGLKGQHGPDRKSPCSSSQAQSRHQRPEREAATYDFEPSSHRGYGRCFKVAGNTSMQNKK